MRRAFDLCSSRDNLPDMIRKLHLHNIGPAPDLDAEFADRLNLITGDNGLGKTFLLDACWFGLTKRTWAGDPFYPSTDVGKDDPPRIDYTLAGGANDEITSHAEYQFSSLTWKGKSGRPAKPGLVIYARIDGGFSVWDPARNYWKDDEFDDGLPSAKSPRSYQFEKSEVWNGLSHPKDSTNIEDVVCNGLLRDVENWRLKKNGAIELLQNVLKDLSADEHEVIRIGDRGVTLGTSAVEIPTLVMPYGEIPVRHAAAGMKRIVSLAYLLVWAWEAHKSAAKNRREDPTRRMVLIFDEIEAHLHPKWQKVILPALLKVVEGFLKSDQASAVQIIATTHAPLILGSVEALWDPARDQLFDFDLEGDCVEFEAIEFARHGSAENWLGSDSFDLPDDYPGYSVHAQKAMNRADAFMLKYPDDSKTPVDEMEEVHRALQQALGGDDEYWPYWTPYLDRRRAVK